MSAQTGIFEETSHKFYFLEYRITNSAEIPSVKLALSESLANQPPGVHLVVGFGADLWQQLNPRVPLMDLKNFESLYSPDGYSAISTQRDVFFWVHSQCHDDNFDAVMQIQAAMSKVATLELDLPGFTYHDSRDLIGFVDGTANPKAEAQQLAALIPEGNDGAGGSFVLTQKWVHDLDAFKSLGVNEQEKIVGRTKKDSIELEGSAMPADSHVSRTDLKLNGTPAKIYRRSAPYGNAIEKGLYFLAFSCDIERFDIQLKSMFGLTNDGVHDRILEYSKPVASAYWFAPSFEVLNNIVKN